MNFRYHVDYLSSPLYDEDASGRLGDRGLAIARSRKVRTPQGTAPGKPRDGAICRIGPQKQVAAVRPFGCQRSK